MSEDSGKLWLRCPRLGGQVPFSYCLQEGGDLPCRRTIRCWQPFFPIEKLLREKMSADGWDRCFGEQAKDKLASLVELANQAKQGASG